MTVHTPRSHSPGRYFLLCLFLVGVLSGCATSGREPASLESMLPQDTRSLSLYRADTGWWTIYNIPQLNRLVEKGLANNIDLARSAVSVNRALYQANLIGADLVPTFSGNVSGSASRNISESAPSSRSVGGELSVSYEVDLWRRLSDAASAREWEYRATIEDLESARLALVNSIVDTYFNLAYLDEAIALTEKTIENYRSIVTITSLRYEAGRSDSVEPAQARQSLLSAENTLLDLQTQKKAAEQTMRDLLNLQPDDPLDPSYPSLLQTSIPDVDLDVPFAVLANRPDLRAAQYRLEGAFKDLSATEKSWYPSVSVGSFLRSSSDGFRGAFDVPFAGGSVTVNLPFLDWNRVYWNVKISEADYDATRLNFEQAVTSALNEVDRYEYAWSRAREIVRNTDAKYVEDVKVSRYYRERYDAGAGDLWDWLNALNTEASSQLALLSSRYTQIQYENMVYKSLGGRY